MRITRGRAVVARVARVPRKQAEVTTFSQEYVITYAERCFRGTLWKLRRPFKRKQNQVECYFNFYGKRYYFSLWFSKFRNFLVSAFSKKKFLLPNPKHLVEISRYAKSPNLSSPSNPSAHIS